jgi:hypothetical protein
LSLSIMSENAVRACCLRYWLFWLKRPQNPYRAKEYSLSRFVKQDVKDNVLIDAQKAKI